MRRSSAIWITTIIAVVVGCGGRAVAQQLSDDNGEESFIQQVIPKLFGRKPKGALEVQLLLDVDNQVGRAAVVRSLMKSPEFVDHWTEVLVDMLRLQRIGDRAQDQSCFGSPTRTGVATTSLAVFVRDQPPGTAVAPPGGAFNMIDLIRSAIALDDLSPIYRAYPVSLLWKFNPMIGNYSVGDALNQTMLNRSADCVSCHSSAFSVTGNANNSAQLSASSSHPPTLWLRTWPAPFDAEQALYGPGYGGNLGQQFRSQTYGIFRIDQSQSYDSSTNTWVAQTGATTPWGMVPECGKILMNLTSLPSTPAQFAGKQGDHIGLVDLLASFKTGSDTLKTAGLRRPATSTSLPLVPGDQALAYLTAEDIVERVWKEILGAPLTIANYFPRNKAQRDVLLELTNQVFNTERWSLRALIADIMTGSGGLANGYFNRMAPDVDPNTPAYRLPMIMDPWVQKNPTNDPPPLDPLQHFNGQGELVHRYSARSLLHSVASSLGWPEPQRFPPDMGGYPNLQFEKTIGQFISDDYQGRDGVDFQGLLSWEAQPAQCDKAAVGVANADWIDRLKIAVDAYNAANPSTPLTIYDVVIVLKDWLTGEAFVGTTLPTPLDPAHPPLSEAAALAALFGSPLTAPFSSVTDWEKKLRHVCGSIIESAQFMLAGIRPTLGLAAPKIRVCNSGTPCSYQEMCQDLVHLSGYLVFCGTSSVAIIPSPNLVCPPNVCRAFTSFGIAQCAFGACNVPVGIPILQGPPVPDCLVCGLPWVDLELPTAIYLNTPAVSVVRAADAEYRAFGATAFQPLRSGMRLASGSVVRVRAGSILDLRSAKGSIRTPKGGMPGKNEAALRAVDRALLDSVRMGETDRVAALLDTGANANALDAVGRTPLMFAARRGDTSLVGLLLGHGANVFAQTPRGFTAADFAAAGRHDKVVAALVRVGATVKSPKALAQLGREADREEPWYIFVGYRPSSRPRQATFVVKDLRLQRLWEKQALTSGGVAGPPLTLEQAKDALARYMQTGFAYEHRALAGSRAAK
jgi:hypothetical protein